MAITIDLVLIANGVILAVLLGVGGYVRSTLHELRVLNGRIIKLEEWRSEHTMTDMETHKAILREIEWRTSKNVGGVD